MEYLIRIRTGENYVLLTSNEIRRKKEEFYRNKLYFWQDNILLFVINLEEHKLKFKYKADNNYLVFDLLEV
jgi:hypothetical protein